MKRKTKKCSHKDVASIWLTEAGISMSDGLASNSKLVGTECLWCGARGVASVGYADEPTVDVEAACIEQDRVTGRPIVATSAQASGMASLIRWYDPTHERWAWDSGWLARAIEEHDAIQLDEELLDGLILTAFMSSGVVGLHGFDVDPVILSHRAADDLSDDLALCSDAARQALKDRYWGDSAVVELEIGPDETAEPAQVEMPLEPFCASNECTIRRTCIRVPEACIGTYPKLAGRQIEPSPNTIAQPPRSWPPNTGCEPDGDL